MEKITTIDRLIREIQNLKMGYKEIAEYTGLNRTTIWNIKNGHIPSVKTIRIFEESGLIMLRSRDE